MSPMRNGLHGKCRVPNTGSCFAEYLTSFANQMIKVLVEKDGGGKVHEIIIVLIYEASLNVRKGHCQF